MLSVSFETCEALRPLQDYLIPYKRLQVGEASPFSLKKHLSPRFFIWCGEGRREARYKQSDHLRMYLFHTKRLINVGGGRRITIAPRMCVEGTACSLHNDYT